MVGRCYFMNVGRGCVMNVERGYVIQNSESVSQSVTKVGIELLGQLKISKYTFLDNVRVLIQPFH